MSCLKRIYDRIYDLRKDRYIDVFIYLFYYTFIQQGYFNLIIDSFWLSIYQRILKQSES